MTSIQHRGPFALSILMTEREHFLVQRLWSQVRKIKSSTSRVLYGCHLSRFVSPWHALIQSDEEKKATFLSVLLVAVVRKAKDSPLVFAVISANSPYTEVTQRLLERANVSTIAIDIEAVTDEAVDEICSRVELAFGSINKTSGLVTNKSEYRSLKLTQSALGLLFPLSNTLKSDSFAQSIVDKWKREAEAKYWILHEIAASWVISAGDIHKLALEHSELADYLETTSFDIVVATPPPLGHALLAIQVDGGVHKEPRKRLNDKKMDRLCTLAELPLLRINEVDYPRFWNGNEGEWQDFIAEFPHRFLSFVVRNISKDQRYSLDIDKVEHRRVDRTLKRYRRLENRILEKLPNAALSVEQKLALFQRAADELGISEERAFDVSEHDADAQSDAEGLSGIYFDELNRMGKSVEITVDWDADRCSASVIVYDHKAKPPYFEPIRLPPLGISGVGVRVEKQFIESFMKQEALRVALEIVERGPMNNNGR